MKFKHLIIAGLAACAAVATPSIAQPGPGPQQGGTPGRDMSSPARPMGDRPMHDMRGGPNIMPNENMHMQDRGTERHHAGMRHGSGHQVCKRVRTRHGHRVRRCYWR